MCFVCLIFNKAIDHVLICFYWQQELEVCGSRNPMKQEEDIDSPLSERMPHLNKMLWIMVMEVEDLKMAARNAIKKDVNI
jgi:hypothetical protein